jgi:hypothetical protein
METQASSAVVTHDDTLAAACADACTAGLVAPRTSGELPIAGLPRRRRTTGAGCRRLLGRGARYFLRARVVLARAACVDRAGFASARRSDAWATPRAADSLLASAFFAGDSSAFVRVALFAGALFARARAVTADARLADAVAPATPRLAAVRPARAAVGVAGHCRVRRGQPSAERIWSNTFAGDTGSSDSHWTDSKPMISAPSSPYSLVANCSSSAKSTPAVKPNS